VTVTYFVASKGIEAFGSTPNNRATNLGITPQDIHDYARKDKEGKLNYVKEKNEERNKELQEENEKLREDINKLEKRLISETQE
jgi:predicted transcriptional regulator